jgi:hypothetical protein
MSYHTQALLQADPDFNARVRCCMENESKVHLEDSATPADQVSLANAILVGAGAQTSTFMRMVAGAPGFDTTVDKGDGTIDSTLIQDADIDAAVQAGFPQVAAIYYNSDGTVKPL